MSEHTTSIPVQNQAEATCSEEGCKEGQVFCRGFCRMHYRQRLHRGERAEKKPGKRCFPLFSPEDADLATIEWRPRRGYAASTTKNIICGVLCPKGVAAHRLVLARSLGIELGPEDFCDHINFDTLDCRRSNLRLFTRKQNSQHRRGGGSIGIRGVTYDKKCKKWRASVGSNGRRYYCGLHDTPEEAGVAAANMRKKLGFAGEDDL